MATTDGSDLNDLLVALRHPLRRTILRVLAGDEPRSPSELADTLDQPLSNLSYHVRVLVDCGALKLVRTQQVRGSTQHFYRSVVKAEWAQSVLDKTKRPRGRGRDKARKTRRK